MAFWERDPGFYKQILTLGGPIAAQQIITVGVNMMDNIMLGQLDETAMTASAMAVQVHNLFHFMCMGLSMGAGVLFARYWGAGEKRSMRKTLTLMYRSCLILTGLFTLAVGLFPAQVMALLTPEADVIQQGVGYLRWSLPCFFLYGLSLTTTNILRSSRQMRIPMLTSIGAFFINIFFNWVFIFGRLGAPAMGVSGAALGTLISRCFEFICICGFFFLKDKTVSFRVKDLAAPCADLAPEYLRICLPVVVSDTLLGLGNSMTAAVVGHMGKVFASAHSITAVTQQITTVFTASLGQSAVILTGNTLGEGDVDRATRQGWSFFFLALVLGSICGGIVVLISPWVAGYYNITEETFDVAIELMRSVGIITVFMATGSILTKGVLRGGGDTRFLMVADVFFLWAVSVPLGAAAGLIWNWPPFWVLLCLKLDHILKTLLCLARLCSGKWIKKIKGVG